MKKINAYAPLKVIETYSSLNILSWDEIDHFRTFLQQLGNCWYDGIFIPVWGVLLNFMAKDDNHIPDNVLPEYACVYAALAAWRRSKEVYRFAPEMEQMLYNQAEDCELPVEIFLHLPYACIYIETPGLCDGKYHGFFVFLDQNKDKSVFILRCIAVIKDTFTLDFYEIEFVQGTSLKEGILAAFLESELSAFKRTGKCSRDIINRAKDKVSVLLGIVQLLLYIAAQNTDMQVSDRSIRKNSPPSAIKDKYREVREWEVGYRVVKRISRAEHGHGNNGNNKLIETERETGRCLAPHMRRGHWHTYWIGKRTDENRKTVLRWIAPTFINCKTPDRLPVVVNQYDK